MRTAIYVFKGTTLTIDTNETLDLMQLGSERPVQLVPGTNTVTVEAGVFKVVSRDEVRVTASSEIEVAITPDDKDKWPEVTGLAAPLDGLSAEQVQAFFVIPGAKSSLTLP